MAQFKVTVPVVEYHVFYVEADDHEDAEQAMWDRVHEHGSEPDKYIAGDETAGEITVEEIQEVRI